jgi:hypothetical protein
VDLRDQLSPHALDQVMNAYLAEGQRTAEVLRAIRAVDGALRAAAPERGGDE